MNRFIPLLLASSVVGCDSPVEVRPDEQGRVLGTVEHYGDGPTVSIPRTVKAGEDFTVAVSTYGNGCTDRGDTEVELWNRSATVRPYDHEPTTDTVCIDILRVHVHEAVLRFDHAGWATVTFVGRKLPSDHRVSVTRTVIVQ